MAEQDQEQQKKELIGTTDSLEAVNVFRNWKNFLFVILLLGMLVLQLCFWLTDLGMTTKDKTAVKTETSADKSVIINPKGIPEVSPTESNEPEQAMELRAGPNQPAKVNEAEMGVNQPTQKEKKDTVTANERDNFSVDRDGVAWLVRLVNFVLIITGILFCLTMLFTLKVSLVGRLGGINHIARAFFISLVFLVLLLPWQALFGSFVKGIIFAPSDLFAACDSVDNEGMIGFLTHYLRFSIYWIIGLLLLIVAQTRSGRWSKTILRRLEVM